MDDDPDASFSNLTARDIQLLNEWGLTDCMVRKVDDSTVVAMHAPSKGDASGRVAWVLDHPGGWRAFRAVRPSPPYPNSREQLPLDTHDDFDALLAWLRGEG